MIDKRVISERRTSLPFLPAPPNQYNIMCDRLTCRNCTDFQSVIKYLPPPPPYCRLSLFDSPSNIVMLPRSYNIKERTYKAMVAHDTILVHPDFTKQLIVYTYVSDLHIRGVISYDNPTSGWIHLS